jgi:hypothetical protein
MEFHTNRPAKRLATGAVRPASQDKISNFALQSKSRLAFRAVWRGVASLDGAGRLMTSAATGDGTVALERCLGMAMAVEAKGMESRLDSLLEIRPAAAVALHAQSPTPSVGVVVMADQTVDHAVLAVRKIERDGIPAMQQRFAQGVAHRARKQARDG